MPAMPTVSETSNEADSPPPSAKVNATKTTSTTRGVVGVCTEKCIQDESETWLYKCKHQIEICGGCKHCHLCESWCEAHTNEWQKKCKNIQCKACDECQTSDATATNVTKKALKVEKSPDTAVNEAKDVTVKEEQQQPVTPPEVNHDEKVEQKQKKTETSAELKDVEKVEHDEQTNDAAIEKEKVVEQSTGTESKQSSTKAISSPASTSTSSAPTPSPNTSASTTTTTVIEPPPVSVWARASGPTPFPTSASTTTTALIEQPLMAAPSPQADYDYDTDLMLVGEHCLYNDDCESQVCNSAEKKKKNRVCLTPEPTTLPTSSPTEDDVVEDGEHCIYDEECRSGDCSDGKKRARICLSADNVKKETDAEKDSEEQPTVNENKVEMGNAEEDFHGMETEKGDSDAGKEDKDIEVENKGEYFDDDGNKNEYEPINEEHDDGSDAHNSTEKDNTTGTIQENTAPVLGGSYCTYSPDYDCYSRGWPDCCGSEAEACPVTRPVCDVTKTVDDTENVTGDDADDYIAAMKGITNNPSVSSGVRIPPSPSTPYNIDVNDNATSNLENEEQPQQQQQALSVSPTVSPSVLIANDKNDSTKDPKHPGHAASSPHQNEEKTTLRPSNMYTPSPVAHQQYAIRSREPTVPTPYRTFLPTLFEPPQTNIIIDQIPAQPAEEENWEEKVEEELSKEVEKAEENISEIQNTHGGSFLTILTLCLFVGAGFVYLRERRRRRAWRRGFRHGDMATGSDANTFTFRAVGRSSSSGSSEGSVSSGGGDNQVRRRMD